MVVLGINFWDEPRETVADFARQEKLSYRMLLEGRAVGVRYGVTSIPTSVWIDPEGIVVDAAVGFDGPKRLDEKTRKILARGG